MTPEMMIAAAGFALASSITPGPNNLMVMTSGANFGSRRTVPHVLGIAGGFGLMLFLVGLGLAGLFHRWPMAMTVLKVLCVLYMLWLAWRLVSVVPAAAADKPAATRARPMSFLQAAGFQWVNPKAWALALSGSAIYAPGQSLKELATLAVIFGLVCLPSAGLWTVLGEALRRFLAVPLRLRIFNGVMAALLVLSLWPVLKM